MEVVQMTFETKEMVLEKILSKKKPKCPNCNAEMSIWETPSMPFGDGLGWGVPYLFICFNDNCPTYVKGWENIQDNYGHKASYRCMCYPDNPTHFDYMPVFSPQGASGQIIDNQSILQEEMLKQSIKKGFSILTDCYISKDIVTIAKILIDPTEPMRVRLKAAEMLGDVGEVEAIEPVKNYKFGNEKLQVAVDNAIKKIHKKFFTKECPFCAEIIKKRAKICKHCGKDVAGI